MNEKQFLKSFGEIDEAIIQEAMPKKYRIGKQDKSTLWKKWTLAVASAYLLISSIGIALWFYQEKTPQNEAVTEPQILVENQNISQMQAGEDAAGQTGTDDLVMEEVVDIIPETGMAEIKTESAIEPGAELTTERATETVEDGAVGEPYQEYNEEYPFPEVHFYHYNNGEYKIYSVTNVPKDVGLGTVVERCLNLNLASGVLCKGYESHYRKPETKTEGELVMHQTGEMYYKIDLEGEELSEQAAIALINTLVHSTKATGICYVDLYINGTPYQMSHPRQASGYTYIEVPTVVGYGDPAKGLPFPDRSADDNLSRADASEEWVENADEMVEMTFVVKDKQGNPVPNIACHIEYMSGEKGSYQSGYGFTDLTGTFTRKLHPNATYTIFLEKQNMISYTSEITPVVYERLTETFDVTVACEMHLLWDEPIQLEERKNSVTIDFGQLISFRSFPLYGPLLQLFTENGGQIQLGYIEDNAGWGKEKFVWNDATDGKYYLSVLQFDPDSSERLVYNETYYIEIKDGVMKNIKEMPEPVTIPE